MTGPIPDYLIEMISDCEHHDTEWGRSCFYCGSNHGRYDAPLEHYIDCPWLRACEEFGIPVDGRRHAVFEPRLPEPCGVCGWVYVSKDDWRGRETPESVGDFDVHVAHLAEAEGLTVDEWKARPFSFVNRLSSVTFILREEGKDQ